MRSLKAFFGKHKIINVIVCVISVWVIMLCVDFFSVDANGGDPICCIETTSGSGHYVGLGYSFDVAKNPGTGKQEYAVYVFGNLVKSTFTNEIEVSDQ